MSIKPILAALDDVLLPHGFRRTKQCWNRRTGEFVDVVQLSSSKSRPSVTIDIGVLHVPTFIATWGEEVPAMVEEVKCTARRRVGFLLGDLDVWWDPGSVTSPGAMAEALRTHGLAFVDSLHTASAIRAHLEARKVGEKGFPPETVYLAVLCAHEGDTIAACAVLQAQLARLQGAWVSRVREVAEGLGCQSA